MNKIEYHKFKILQNFSDIISSLVNLRTKMFFANGTVDINIKFTLYSFSRFLRRV